MKRHLLMAAMALCASSLYAASVTCSTISTSQVAEVQLTIDGFDCSNVLDFSGNKPILVGLPGTPPENAITVPGVFSLNSFAAVINPDPMISYAFGITNLSSVPLVTSLVITSPYTGGPYDTLVSSHQLGVTDSNGNNSVVVTTANGETFIHQPFVDGVDIDGLNTGCTVTPGAFGSASCFASGPPTTVAISTPPTGTFGVRVNFTLSPGDTASTSGLVVLSPTPTGHGTVPEPSTLAMFAMGLMGVGIWRRRAQRTQ